MAEPRKIHYEMMYVDKALKDKEFVEEPFDPLGLLFCTANFEKEPLLLPCYVLHNVIRLSTSCFDVQRMIPMINDRDAAMTPAKTEFVAFLRVIHKLSQVSRDYRRSVQLYPTRDVYIALLPLLRTFGRVLDFNSLCKPVEYLTVILKDDVTQDISIYKDIHYELDDGRPVDKKLIYKHARCHLLQDY